MTAASGYAIVIGVGKVNPEAYDGTWEGGNPACAQDAHDMVVFAEKKGFQIIGALRNGTPASEPILSAEATKEAITDTVYWASEHVKPHDVLLVYFSGHGASQPKKNGGHTALAQGVCLADGYFWDFEWTAMLSEFREGARVLSVVDSCYGGGFGPSDPLERSGGILAVHCPKPRAVPHRIAQVVWDREKDKFEALRARNVAKGLKAWYLQLGACQANQLACTKGDNGLFTQLLLGIANDQDDLNLNYRQLHRAIVAKSEPMQSPSYYSRGTIDDQFGKQVAFSI